MLLAAPQSESAMKGKVIDKSSGEPLGWATVSLMKADSTIVTGVSCNEKGEYVLSAPAGQYICQASLIGYKDVSQKISLLPGDNDLPDIIMEEDANMLAAASLTERVKLVEMKIDKIVMNVRESAFAQGSNALELMKKAPGVTIDKDGNVKLNGKPVSVWIDGRPTYVDGKSLESLLRSTNSESIDKFELMEHPSAKYDAAGQGGIINIKTKRNFRQGFNGSLGLGGGGMYFKEAGETPMSQSLWANLAYRTKNTNTFFNVYEGSGDNLIRINNEMNLEKASFLQKSTSLFTGFNRNYNVKFGNDWFIDSKNTFGIIANIPGECNVDNSKSSMSEQFVNGQRTQSAVTAIENGPNRAIRHNLNMNYTHVFNEALNSEITANLDYYHNASEDCSSQKDEIVSYIESDIPFTTAKSMISDQIYDIYSAKADYQSVLFKKFMFESGAKWALSSTDNNSVETMSYTPDNVQYFIYREHVAAMYASLAGQLAPKMSFKAGLRGEYTNSFGDWKSISEQTRRDYLDLFPTLFIGYQASPKWNLSAVYTRRINRPRYEMLNPAKVYVDSKTYIVGDPDILPQYSNGMALSANYGQYLSGSIGYDYSYNIINQIPSFSTGGNQYMTWGNLGKQKVGVLSFNVSALPVTKWMMWTLNANELYMTSTSYLSNLDRNSWSTQAYTDLTFILPKDWKIDLDAYFSGPMQYACYKIYGSWASNIAVKKNLLDNKLILTFKLDDIFRTSAVNLDVLDETGSGGVTAFRQKFYNQKLSFDITWNFGKAQKPSKSRKVGNLEEMSRVGSGSGIGK